MLPPGVKSVAPQINLVYTSGSGNGIAGYGWNITGITAISRLGKNIEKDGEVIGTRFDYSDYYSFNGQRLILKSGGYGKDGAEYRTEKFSNVKIKSIGEIIGQVWQGPEYWEVTFEDGSQAWYGATKIGLSAAKTPVEYDIVKWKDAQGNYITYNYIQDADTNVAIISSIEWGGNETQGKDHFNSISFNYKIRSLIETSYVRGQKFSQDKLLDNIIVYSNKTLFKQYNIEHGQDINISKYEYVNNIKEFNAEGKEANPVAFYKPNVSYIAKRQDLNANLISENQKLGDFDGDGRVDLLYYSSGSSGYYECLEEDDNGNCIQNGNHIQDISLGTYIIFNKLDGNNTPTKVSDEDLSKGIVVGGILGDNNKLFTTQGIIKYEEIKNVTPSKLILKMYVLENKNFNLIKTKELLISDYDHSFYMPADAQTWEPHVESITSFGGLKNIDINGDGISELVLNVYDNICTYEKDGPDNIKVECNIQSRNFIIDLTSINNSSNQLFWLGEMTKSINEYDIIDIDGDGKSDFIEKGTDDIKIFKDLRKYSDYYLSKDVTFI